MTTKIGFVGLGIMGKGMANRLITQLEHTQLVVWNRTSDVATQFASAYDPEKVFVASSPAEVVHHCNVTYSMLSTLEASREVVCVFVYVISVSHICIVIISLIVTMVD